MKMSKIQITLLILSFLLAVFTAFKLVFYLEAWAWWIDYEGIIRSPGLTVLIFKGRYVLATFALILPFTGLILNRKRETLGTVFFLSTLISSLCLALLATTSVNFAYLPLCCNAWML